MAKKYHHNTTPTLQDFSAGNKRIYVTQDLAKRYDYVQKKRFRYYDDDLCTYDPDVIDEPNEMSNEFRGVPKSVTLIKSILGKYGTPLYPIYDRKTRSSIPVIADLDSEVADKNIEKSDSGIKCALFGFEKKSEIFRAVIRNGIPIIFISPSNTKCEWIKLKEGECESSNECIECQQCSESRNFCKASEPVHKEGEVIPEVVKDYRNIFFDVYSEETLDLNEIPVFEYSSAIDIVRWFKFYEEYNKMYTARKKRRLANIYSSTDLVIEGLFPKGNKDDD
jgi:hypothetical protein